MGVAWADCVWSICTLYRRIYPSYTARFMGLAAMPCRPCTASMSSIELQQIYPSPGIV